jgi:hypothetical protein
MNRRRENRRVTGGLGAVADVTNLGVRHSHLSSSKCPFVPASDGVGTVSLVTERT